jgi:hypothetical protein
MSETSGQLAGNMRPTGEESTWNYDVELRNTFESNKEELFWIAEIITGSREEAAQSLDEAMELAGAAQCVGREWVLPWVKRLLVHAALKRIGANIRREFLPPGHSLKAAGFVAIGLSAPLLEKLRAISPEKITASCDAPERACFILFAYLRYPLLDCALLLGCPPARIELICLRTIAKLSDTNGLMPEPRMQSWLQR